MAGRSFTLCPLLMVLAEIGATVCFGAEHVIHISVDGLRPSYLQQSMDNGDAPNFERFLLEGAWTMNARTDFSHTITLPNHTSMLTSRPVSLPAGMPAQTQHGYTSNSDPSTSQTIHNFTSPDWYKASTFDVVHDAGLSTALYASKSKFILYEQSYNATNGADHPNGRDKIDAFANPEATATMQTQLLAGLAANRFDYTFVHYANCDDAGHTYEWGSSQYMDAIEVIDGYLGELFELVESDEALAGRTAIILSADHGGNFASHSNATQPFNYTIPFFAWGAGVGRGDLYSFNLDTRTNPGTGRPDYNAAGQPIRNGDGGNLSLDLLGLDPIPGSLINAAQNLRVAIPGDFNADGSVDAADYVRLRKGLGADYSMDDYNLWTAQFGTIASNIAGESTAAAPEPATMLLVLLATAFHLSVQTIGARRS